MIKQREIKFRAWSPSLNEMAKSKIIMRGTFMRFTPCISFKSGTIKTVTDEILTQFTGLKDKQGIDIYEGDVLVNPEFTDEGFWAGKDGFCVVEYNDELTRFLLTFHSCFTDEGYSGKSEHDQLYVYVENGYYVKGNIYDEYFKDHI